MLFLQSIILYHVNVIMTSLKTKKMEIRDREIRHVNLVDRVSERGPSTSIYTRLLNSKLNMF